LNSNNRKNPRYAALLQVKIEDHILSTTNISLGGAQLSCYKAMGLFLIPRFKTGSVDITLLLSGDATVNIKCEVRYLSEYDESEYLIGLQFVEFSESDRGILDLYIKEVIAIEITL
jgi:c-di-GMP-binding flagellar brake protein YcgR